MKRIRIKEIHEMSWCPELFRDSLTEFLSIIWAIGVYKQAMIKMSQVIKVLKFTQIVDLCSGAGDYIPGLLKNIRSECPDSQIVIWKTDLYPNKKFFNSGDPQIKYWQEPLPADRAFSRFDALFSMFSALHHFDEDELLTIFSHAARNKKCFTFFDISQRRFLTDISPNIFLPVTVWFAAPFFKRLTWKHIVFIYLIPIIPLMIGIDGTISRMRAYKQSELQILADEVQKKYPDFAFRITEHKLMGGLQKVTEIFGCPAESLKRFENDIDQKKHSQTEFHNESGGEKKN